MTILAQSKPEYLVWNQSHSPLTRPVLVMRLKQERTPVAFDENTEKFAPLDVGVAPNGSGAPREGRPWMPGAAAYATRAIRHVSEHPDDLRAESSHVCAGTARYAAHSRQKKRVCG